MKLASPAIRVEGVGKMHYVMDEHDFSYAFSDLRSDHFEFYLNRIEGDDPETSLRQYFASCQDLQRLKITHISGYGNQEDGDTDDEYICVHFSPAFASEEQLDALAEKLV